MLTFGNNLRRFVKKLSYCSEIEKLLIRYVEAFDLLAWEDSFIRLWAILEKLTDTSHLPYGKTIKRASGIFERAEYHKKILLNLRDFRNALIHEGRQATDIESLLFQVKRYVEWTFFWHFYQGGKFKSIEESGKTMALLGDKKELGQKYRLIKVAMKFIKKKNAK